MPRNVSSSTAEALLQRAERRCECHAAACRHHRPNSRCTKGLRGQGWHAIRRVDTAGEKLWNLTAVCDACWKALGMPD
jgi:hypothetical protein